MPEPQQPIEFRPPTGGAAQESSDSDSSEPSSASVGNMGYVDEEEETQETGGEQGQGGGQQDVDITDLGQVSNIITSVGLGLAIRYALAYTSFLIVPGLIFWLVKIGNDTSFKMKCAQLKEITNKLPLDQVPNPYVKAAVFVINIGPDPIIMQLTFYSTLLMFLSGTLCFLLASVMYIMYYCNENKTQCLKSLIDFVGLEAALKMWWNS